MTEHKFKIGQAVLFRPRRRTKNVPVSNRPYRIIHRLPEAGNEPQYQIRCTHTDAEFAASEGELRLVTARY